MFNKLRNEQIKSLYTLLCGIRMKKSQRMRSTRHVSRLSEVRNDYKIWPESLKEGSNFQELDVEGG